MLDLSIIIISFNTKSLLRDCLNSIIKNKGEIKLEIIVIDNGSSDKSPQMVEQLFPQVKLIKNKENLGFSKANNLGIRKSKGKYILLLNSDTVIMPKTLETMINFMERNPQIGVSTCRVELPSGEIDPACHRGFPTPWRAFTYFSGLEKLFPKIGIFSGYHLLNLPLNTIHEIDSPSGCFYLVRKKAIKEVGNLDEDYFMYGEDLDWSFRFKKKGWKIVYFPFVKILHRKYSSGLKKKLKPSLLNYRIREKTIRAFYNAMRIFYNKHYKNKYPTFLKIIIFKTIALMEQLNLTSNYLKFVLQKFIKS